jgi:hypothetical protein
VLAACWIALAMEALQCLVLAPKVDWPEGLFGDAAYDVGRQFALPYFVSMLLGLFLFSRWLRELARGEAALGAQLSISPNHAAVACFIPVLNLIVPGRLIAALASYDSPTARRAAIRWWAITVAALLMFGVMLFCSERGQPVHLIAAMETHLTLSVVALLLFGQLSQQLRLHQLARVAASESGA